jgi:hypothetical protein
MKRRRFKMCVHRENKEYCVPYTLIFALALCCPKITLARKGEVLLHLSADSKRDSVYIV